MIYYIITNNIFNHSRYGWQYVGRTAGENKNYYCGGVLINRDIKKYGIENFPREIITKDNNIDDWDLANWTEKFWIKIFNTFEGDGYNLTPGGDGIHKGAIFTEKTKEKMRLKKLGKKRPDVSLNLKGKKRPDLSVVLKGIVKSIEHRKNLAISKTGYVYSEEGKNNMSLSAKGKKKSIEHGRHISIAKTCGHYLKKFKHIFQFDLEGNFIKEWVSALDIERELKISSSVIYAICDHRKGHYTAGGFKWEYKNEN